jgi:hypothetical protein
MRGLWISVHPGENTGRASCPRNGSPANLSVQHARLHSDGRYHGLNVIANQRHQRHDQRHLVASPQTPAQALECSRRACRGRKSVNLLQHKLRDRSVDVHKKPPDQPARLGFACGFSGTTGCGPGGCTPGGIGRYPRERIGFPVDQAKTA